MTPEEVAAHLEINQVVMRSCRGVDRGDLTLSRDEVPGQEWAVGPDYPAGGRRAADPSARLFGPTDA